MMLLLIFTAEAEAQDFVKGADVGFLQGQERRGVVFHDREGHERECLELLKNDYRLSAIRMRVWVDPRGGDCDKFALLAMAKRVKALGMDLMVDFHYSDSWADPGKQPIPKAWLGHSFEEMKQDLRQHTIEVLTLLRDNGIAPRWVQVGNETTNGLLWSVKTNEHGWEVKDEQHPEKMEEGRRQLSRVIREARHETGGHCRGVFYWEPQCTPGGYKLGAFDSNATPTAIMDGFIEQEE